MMVLFTLKGLRIKVHRCHFPCELAVFHKCDVVLGKFANHCHKKTHFNFRIYFYLNLHSFVGDLLTKGLKTEISQKC